MSNLCSWRNQQCGGMTQTVLLVLVACMLCTEAIAQDGAGLEESCDVMGAVACFSNMADVPKPHILTDQPEAEIRAPCREQVSKNTELRNCLDNFLGGCDSVKVDANTMINVSESFCSKVLECQNFTADYRAGLICTSDMIHTLITPGSANKEENCKKYANCVNGAIQSCSALTTFLYENWKLFNKTCMRVNVTTPQELIANDSAPSLICSELYSVTMKLSDCYLTFVTSVGTKENLEVRSYCQAAHMYEVCVDDALIPCPQFGKIFKNSINNYFLAIGSFCGPERGMHAICDLSGLNTCFANVDTSLWKLEKVIIEGMDMDTFDFTKWAEYAKQITSATRSFAAVCRDVPGKINDTGNCLSSYMLGCPMPLRDAYRVNTNYLAGLCSTTASCLNTSSDSIDQCGTNAFNEMTTLANSNSLTIATFTPSLCNIFKTLVNCLDTQFRDCANDDQYVLALYMMLVEDLQPFCEKDNFIQLQNVTFNTTMETFLECRYMPVVSYEIGMCTKTYLYSMARSPTNTQEICKALIEWDECTDGVTLDCSLLHSHILDMVENTRKKLEAPCPRPTTQPPPADPEMPDVNLTTSATNSTGIAVMQVKCQPVWMLCLNFFIMPLWMW